MELEKDTLLKQIIAQRTLPITEASFTLYQNYRDCIDARNHNDMASYFFYTGECYFRIGNFEKSMGFLTRCLKLSKDTEHQYLDVLCYHIMGLINSCLENESIALNYILQCRTISEELHLRYELIASYVNEGIIYYDLGDFETALQCFNSAYESLNGLDKNFDTLYVVCASWRGVVFCQLGEYKIAQSIYQKLLAFTKDTSNPYDKLSMIYLSVHLYDFLRDDSFMIQNLEQLLALPCQQDFLSFSRYYFSCCSYLIEHGFAQQADSLLKKMAPEIRRGTLYYLKHSFLLLKARYTKAFAPADYPAICCRLADLRPSYEEEQRRVTRYSLSYVELLRKTKIDSDLFQEQSQLDHMTGLLNKYTIQFLIEEDLAKALPEKRAVLLLIDLDHFKKINDTLGHLIGDEYICLTAKVIRNYFKDIALCGRVGGDEFLVYLHDAPDASFVQLQAELLLQEIERQTAKIHGSVNAHASIGIAFFSEHHYNYTRLFAAADQALYNAKISGRNKLVVAED